MVVDSTGISDYENFKRAFESCGIEFSGKRIGDELHISISPKQLRNNFVTNVNITGNPYQYATWVFWLRGGLKYINFDNL